MYTLFSPMQIGEKKLSKSILFSLSQYVKILCNVNQQIVDYPLQNDLKVVIAAGLTSSHPEQRS